MSPLLITRLSMSGCTIHIRLLFVFAGIHRDTEKKIVVMETAGAEALSVFPSENPSRHIRISTAKKVRCDFLVMCNGSLGYLMASWTPEVLASWGMMEAEDMVSGIGHDLTPQAGGVWKRP